MSLSPDENDLVLNAVRNMIALCRSNEDNYKREIGYLTVWSGPADKIASETECLALQEETTTLYVRLLEKLRSDQG